MSTKHTSTVLAKCHDDEPIFVLRAQDKSAPDIIRFWLLNNPNLSAEKRADARSIMTEMAKWPNRKMPD